MSENILNAEKKVADMAGLALSMWQMTYKTFMDHDLELLAEVLQKEDRLNNYEKELTSEFVEVARGPIKESQKKEVLIFVEIVEDLELIGDYCKDILERVQIKIEEKLLFSEDAVKEYTGLYKKTESAFKEIVSVLEKGDYKQAKNVLKNQEHIDSLVDELRLFHNQRLIKGVCQPFACNMFLNMLDFTAAIYYHIKKIAKNISKLK